MNNIMWPGERYDQTKAALKRIADRNIPVISWIALVIYTMMSMPVF